MNSLTDLRAVVDVVTGVDTHSHTHLAAASIPPPTVSSARHRRGLRPVDAVRRSNSVSISNPGRSTTASSVSAAATTRTRVARF